MFSTVANVMFSATFFYIYKSRAIMLGSLLFFLCIFTVVCSNDAVSDTLSSAGSLN